MITFAHLHTILSPFIAFVRKMIGRGRGRGREKNAKNNKMENGKWRQI